MNFPRSLARFLSSANPKKWDLIQCSFAMHALPFSTDRVVGARQKGFKPLVKTKVDISVEPTIPKIPSDLPKPSLIPFQAKVANSVHLVGTIDTDIKLQQLSDGIYASVSICVKENMEMATVTSPFWIPIVFRGDLAEIAACHLKKNDVIYVSGQLAGDNLPLTHRDTKENIKLIAHSLNFVKEADPPKRGKFFHKQDEASTSESSDNFKILLDEFEAIDPHKLLDNQEGKMKGLKNSKNTGFVDNISNNAKSMWDELVTDPQKWLDNREDKLKGLLSIKNPDFKHKETGNGLWLNTAPGSVASKLDGLAFGGKNNMPKLGKGKFEKSAGKDHLWKKLVENPKEWWDNRSSKFKPTHPDFKHKDDGEVLWLNSAPSWVLPKLPPPPKEKNANNK